MSQCDRFIQDMFLKRPFISNIGEDSALDIHCLGQQGDRAPRVGVLVLQGLVLENCHFERE